MNKIKKISFVVDKPYYNNKIFDSEYLGSDFFELVKKRFNKKGIEISSNDIVPPSEANIILYNDYRKKYKYKNKLHVLIALESIAVKPDNFNLKKIGKFDLVFTWNSEIVDNIKILNLNYSYDLSYSKFLNFNQKNKFICNISANKFSNHPSELYSERIKAIEFFEGDKGFFDLYGFNWNESFKFPDIYNFFKLLNNYKILRGLGKILITILKTLSLQRLIFKEYRCYKGIIEDKYSVLKKYKFSICYENVTKIEGYITEKIFDCFKTGTVPIYLGANNIKDYIPESTFIDKRNFSTYNELYNYLISIDEESYSEYQENISNYLKSSRARVFDSDYNAKILVDGIIKEYNNKFL